MPLTFAHPAVALPFSRNSKYVNFLALVLGSMAPDFEYFLRGKPNGEIGHTFVGFLVLNLPIVLIVYFVYLTYIHKALFSHLPSILQDTYSQKVDSSRWLKAVVFLYSALFGMLTHVVWDSFTHVSGYMVKKLSFLSNTVHFLSFDIPIFKILQHGSTLVGIALIIGYMYFRTAKNRCTRNKTATSQQKIIYWGLIALLAAFLFGSWSFYDEVSIKLYGVLVVRIIDSALISLLLVSLIFNVLNKMKMGSSLFNRFY
ncbi:DUF4184 family protein [Sporosarcina oncorhynchi]|uniref:DUF4184 family protein n=1 Tax=Sporosarcina oncorhynchi TaxID=3056444 RepID=A0ABZ0L2T5_9BACL|nr:DUF4184 family protein [Sporosarcina sp. T2O-4]WOV86919.1 DUF4184 family protein [Sporosarcina sp. T2O-4]